MRQKIGLFFLVCAVLLVPQLAFAQMVQIFNGEDVNFGTWYPSDGNQSHTQAVCVFKTSAFDSLWDVTLTGDGVGGAFELKNVSGDLPISDIQINTISVTSGVLLADNPNADTSGFPDCNEFGGDNQDLTIIINTTELSAAAPGIYTGTITLEAQP